MIHVKQTSTVVVSVTKDEKTVEAILGPVGCCIVFGDGVGRVQHGQVISMDIFELKQWAQEIVKQINAWESSDA